MRETEVGGEILCNLGRLPDASLHSREFLAWKEENHCN